MQNFEIRILFTSFLATSSLSWNFLKRSPRWRETPIAKIVAIIAEKFLTYRASMLSIRGTK